MQEEDQDESSLGSSTMEDRDVFINRLAKENEFLRATIMFLNIERKKLKN